MERFDPEAALADCRHEFGEHGGVNMSIETSTTFTVLDPNTMPDLFTGQLGPDSGREGCYLYGRHFNPTVYVLGRQLAAIEGMPAGYCTASGLGAIAPVLMQLCEQGDHIVSASAVYGGTWALMHDFLPRKCGVTTSFVPVQDLAAVEAAFTSRTRVLYCETLSNPTLVVADLSKLADIAHRHGAMLVVDNTFSPLSITPSRFGADVVVHSLTKFVNGTSDFIAGAVTGSKEFVQSMMDVHTGALMLLGPTMDPRAAFEISMRLPHLGLRVAEHSRRAQCFAERLRDRGLKVVYPGLPEHPDHALIVSMLNGDDPARGGTYGFGGVMGIDLGDADRANLLLDELQNRQRFGWIAVSLGYFDTLMSLSAASTSSELGDDGLGEAGISPGYLRMSIGYTGSLEQRWGQLERALDASGL